MMPSRLRSSKVSIAFAYPPTDPVVCILSRVHALLNMADDRSTDMFVTIRVFHSTDGEETVDIFADMDISAEIKVSCWNNALLAAAALWRSASVRSVR
jgi:hypothetical protein